MTKDIFTVGPVLSFRGIVDGRWRVTALIGITVAASRLGVDGFDMHQQGVVAQMNDERFAF